MAAKFSRTVSFTRVKYVKTVVENGEAKLIAMPDAVFDGAITDRDKVESLMRRKFGKNMAITIVSIEYESGKYEMSLEEFIRHATKVDDSAPSEDDTDEIGDEVGETLDASLADDNADI